METAGRGFPVVTDVGRARKWQGVDTYSVVHGRDAWVTVN